jgi:EAL domain-containing protein (putative c-di-GMP-specific phosphodiesterase class I)
LSKASDLLGLSDPAEFLRNGMKGGQFVAYCQSLLPLKPISDPPMAEVFVRMREEESAMLPPGDFFPLFESQGMMPELDRWVVRETVARTLSKPKAPLFCVNVSPQTLQDPKFPAFVDRELRFTELARDRLLLEVSELDVAAALPACTRFADALHEIHVRIVLQDFRCTSASFAIWRALKAQYIKIDGSVVRRLSSTEAVQSAIKNTLNVAATNGARVIAEGVEDQETLGELRRLSAHYAQGFVIHMPAPMHEFLK